LKHSWLIVVGILFSSTLLIGQSLDKITLQLKWRHAFQFAGYYAAKEQGYYKEAGLEVDILEATPSTNPIKNVLEGKAQYGVGTSSLLLEYAKGKPLVVLAVVFQQSPYEIHASPKIHSLKDLIGKRIMIEPQSEEIYAYLQKEGISPSQVTFIPHSFSADDLISGKADAMSGYISNEPYYYKSQNYSYQTFSPRSAGIDFYGDNLFTTQSEILHHPKRVQAFREASMRGWKYAKKHRQEVIELIMKKYNPDFSKEHLLYESDQMIPLLQPDLIEIGYMNPARWQHIADTYAEFGLLPKNYPIEPFIYQEPEKIFSTWMIRTLAIGAVVITLFAAVLLYFIRLNKRLRESQRSLKITNAKYEHLVENIAGDYCFFTHDTDGVITYVSPSIVQMLGYTPEEAKVHYGEFVTDHTLNSQIHTHIEATLRGEKRPKYLAQFRHKEGSLHWIEVSENPIFNDKGSVIGVEGVMHDVTSIKEHQKELEYIAHYDPLTGLPNRLLLSDRLTYTIASAHRFNKKLAVIFLDLDGFKPVNDTYGHDVGDELLRRIAKELKTVLREEDTLARIGGDEFVGIITNFNDIGECRAVLDRLIVSLSAPFLINDISIHIGASIGVAIYPDDGMEGDILVRNADQAMYSAKQSGKNRYYFFNV
jgi:diguanylate cyclase (GGDEF)-like protein/PAS domain S-box-containing protein